MKNKHSVNIKWAQPNHLDWYSLFYTDFSKVNESGVYVIWGYNNYNLPVIIKVGQSICLSETLRSYKYDSRENIVMNYLNIFGNLYVTWANLPEASLDGVETYLGKTLFRPLIASAVSGVEAIVVNAPF